MTRRQTLQYISDLLGDRSFILDERDNDKDYHSNADLIEATESEQAQMYQAQKFIWQQLDEEPEEGMQ